MSGFSLPVALAAARALFGGGKQRKEVAAPAVTESTPKKRKKYVQERENPYQILRDAADERLRRTAADGFAPYNSVAKTGTAQDNALSVKQSYATAGIPEQQVYYYANQGFIGYQLCAEISKNWLVKKCCLMPAKDAVRNGFEVTVNSEAEVDPRALEEIKKLDKRFELKKNLIEFIDQGRVFGIRIALFEVDSDDPEYYYKPFNPDGVRPGSYKGISQIDPYWITPQLDAEGSGDPTSRHFYEPTWWNISGRVVHRTHLCIFRTETLPDILKPTYLYGGISVPQKIAERVYASERTANEAPLLVLTKRTKVYKMNTADTVAGEPEFYARMREMVYNQDNFGMHAVDLSEDLQQIDTALADLDAVIMTQYQLVAAAANIPAVKLLGTAPKGFNATGEYEEANYHEELEAIQSNDLTPLVERHLQLCILSYICPKFGCEPFETEVVWKPLDAMTAKEQAELSLIKAQTGVTLAQSGAIDGRDERARLIADPDSGYNGIDTELENDNLLGLFDEPEAAE